MSQPREQTISVCGVGKFRAIATFASKELEGTPFRMAAMLAATSPEPYNFTPERLALVLRSLHPAPQCFLAGEGIPVEDNEAAVDVWQKFVADCEVQNPLLINLRQLEGRTVEETLAIPKDRLLREVLETHMMPHFFGKESER